MWHFFFLTQRSSVYCLASNRIPHRWWNYLIIERYYFRYHLFILLNPTSVMNLKWKRVSFCKFTWASSSLSSNLVLQRGQEISTVLFVSNQPSKHLEWNTWLHPGVILTLCEMTNRFLLQIRVDSEVLQTDNSIDLFILHLQVLIWLFWVLL